MELETPFSNENDTSNVVTSNDETSNIGNVFCGSMDERGFALWDSCEFWCEGVLLCVVGGIGLLGNIGSIAILATRLNIC